MSDNLKGKTLSSTAWKFMERVIAQGVTLVVSIILARILSPDDFGVVSIVTIFFNFANVIITGGLNTALIQKKDSDEYDYTIVLFLSLSISIVLYALLCLLAPLISNLYGKQELIPIIRVMGLILPVMAIKSVVCSYVSANLQFRKFFFATIGGTLASGIVGVLLAVNGFGAWAIVGQQMTNTVIDTVILCLVTKMKLSKKIYFGRIKGLFSFGSRVLISSLIDTAYMELNPLFIGLKYSSADLSFYTKGKSFPSTISSTTTNTVSAVLFPVLSKVQDDKARLLKYVRLYISTVSYLVFPLMLGFFAISDNFVSVVLTDKWLPASAFIKIFCFCTMFDMVASGNCQAMKAVGRSDVFLKIEIIKKISYFVIIGIFMLISKSPIVLALSMVLCTLLSLAINTFPNRKLIGYSYKLQLIDLLPNLLIASVMCVAVYLIGKVLFGNKLIIMIVQIISGVIIYLALSVLTKSESFHYILSTAKEIIRKK